LRWRIEEKKKCFIVYPLSLYLSLSFSLGPKWRNSAEFGEERRVDKFFGFSGGGGGG